MQHLLGEDDVAGRGDRQELGQSLDDADEIVFRAARDPSISP